MAMSLRILLADDESLNALALRAQLEVLGHLVVGSANDGLEAVELALSIPIDLAILDIQMPGLSGIEAAMEISRHKPIPIILLTGYSNYDLSDGLDAAPIFNFLTKPVSLEDLSPAIAIARSRFQEWKEYRDERGGDDSDGLGDRAAIERAKTLVMEARGVSAAGAHRILKRESLDRNEPLGTIARNVLIAGHLLRDPRYS